MIQREEYVKCEKCLTVNKVLVPVQENPKIKVEWLLKTHPDIRRAFKMIAVRKDLTLEKTLSYFIWLDNQVQENKIQTDFIGTPKVESE